MNNYEYAKAFERLAIKIVERHLSLKIDNKRTHVTSETRDYGIDAVIHLKGDHNTKSHTIEAKLRGLKYTLGLKDIASSILFFLVRHGDQHVIVSNVYLTQGTIDVIERLNIDGNFKLLYIDGEETRNILNNLLHTLDDKEEKYLAEFIVKTFHELKQPLKSTKSKKIVAKCTEIIYPSRKKIIQNLIEDVNKDISFIVLRGPQGVGKRYVLECLNSCLDMSKYTIIKINTLNTNTLTLLCYELFTSILGIQVNEIFQLMTLQEKNEIYNIFLESEKEIVDLIFKIFDANAITDENARYLAKKCFQLLFEKFYKLKYIIEFEHLSNTSIEVFEFITSIIYDLPSNVSFIGLVDNNVGTNLYTFPIEYQVIHSGKYKIEEIDEFEPDEAKDYITNTPDFEYCKNDVFSFFGGNPLVLNEAIFMLKRNKEFYSTNSLRNIGTDLETLYSKHLELDLNVEPKLYKLVLLFLLNKNKISLSILENCLNNDYVIQEEYQLFIDYIEQSPLFSKKSQEYHVRLPYIALLLEKLFFDKKLELKKCALKYKASTILTELTPLSNIKLLYLLDLNEVIEIYNKNKNCWQYKCNFEWNRDSLKYICYYLKGSNEDDIDNLLVKSNYYIQYLNWIISADIDKDIKKELRSITQILELYFEQLNKEYVISVADLIAEYYILNYKIQSRTENKKETLQLIEKSINSSWFEFISDKKKVIFLRYYAILFKENGDKENFFNILEEIHKTYKNPYANTIYWANKASQYYVCDSQKALETITECKLEELIQAHPEELSLYLWINNDLAITYYYLDNYKESKRIAKKTLARSEKSNDRDNVARAQNIIAVLNLLEKKISEENLFLEAMKNCVDYNLQSFIHFSVNYLNSLDNTNDLICKLIMNYLKDNSTIIKLLLDGTELSNNRWFVTLISFAEHLLTYTPTVYQELNIVYKDYLTKKNQIHPKYRIYQKLYVLF